MHPTAQLSTFAAPKKGTVMNKHAFTTVVSIIPSFVLASNALAGDSSWAWEVIATPNPTNAEQSVVRDIGMPSVLTMYGPSSGYTLSRTATPSQCTGTAPAWTNVATPQPSPCPECTNVTLWGVDALGPNDVWACGDKNVQGPPASSAPHARHALGWLIMDCDEHTTSGWRR